MTDDLVRRLYSYGTDDAEAAALRIEQLTEALRHFIRAYGLNEEACTGALDKACADARTALTGSPPAPSARDAAVAACVAALMHLCRDLAGKWGKPKEIVEIYMEAREVGYKALALAREADIKPEGSY